MAHLPPCGLSTGPIFLSKGQLCVQGQDTSQAVPGPSASSGNYVQGGYSDSKSVWPGPTSGKFSHPLDSPPNALMSSLDPERAKPTAQKAEGKAERRHRDWPALQEKVASCPFFPSTLTHLRGRRSPAGSGCLLPVMFPSGLYVSTTNPSQGCLK